MPQTRQPSPPRRRPRRSRRRRGRGEEEERRRRFAAKLCCNINAHLVIVLYVPFFRPSMWVRHGAGPKPLLCRRSGFVLFSVPQPSENPPARSPPSPPLPPPSSGLRARNKEPIRLGSFGHKTIFLEKVGRSWIVPTRPHFRDDPLENPGTRSSRGFFQKSRGETVLETCLAVQINFLR